MNKPVRMVAEPASTPVFTAQDYARLMAFGDFAEMRVELIGGELRKMMTSGFSHGEMNILLGAKLMAAYAGTDRRFAIDLAVGIDPLTVRGADIAVVLPDVQPHGPVPADRFVLIVEIAETTLARDLGEKLADYARAGVPDYWVVDLDAKVMHVMRLPDGDRYAERRVVAFGMPVSVPGTDRTIAIG